MGRQGCKDANFTDVSRKHRKMMELHGDMTEHGQPVMTVFHRPRDEAKLLQEQGFDPRSASFQFVDIASLDLGPWMQHLMVQEKWLRGTVDILPVPSLWAYQRKEALKALIFYALGIQTYNPLRNITYLSRQTQFLVNALFHCPADKLQSWQDNKLRFLEWAD